jgi:two-component system NtrC family sensor kinase
MSLKKKIALSFFISASIIAVLAAFEYLSFTEIKKEIRYLEITDTISRKSLQLRRHEKNFFLYSPQKAEEESADVHAYLGELKKLLAESPRIDQADNLSLRKSVADYESRFSAIEQEASRLTVLFEKTKKAHGENAKHLSLVESTFLEQPARAADFLEKVLRLPRDHALPSGLWLLDADIAALRKTGEDILILSKDLDKIAREKAETVIRDSQMAILIFFPLFFIVGIGMLFFISTSVVRRLMLLIGMVEKTGKGSYPHVTDPAVRRKAPDEVGVLIDKFNDMEDQLAEREAELERKNSELMQTRKLAAIGTLASGVAHELNNPLNNIYLSAQVLQREAGPGLSADLKEAVGDIVGQTERVKRIVGDLLEFARGREPHKQEVDLAGLIRETYRRIGGSRDTGRIAFTLNAADPVVVTADQGQMEQVFTNLFLNAVDAMQGRGELSVSITRSGQTVKVAIHDAGRGIPREALDKIFEPFYTTKDRGTGLGLAIVYNIVRKHYGDISVESEEGKGTTFTIRLPGENI